jgi:hypothetical protein
MLFNVCMIVAIAWTFYKGQDLSGPAPDIFGLKTGITILLPAAIWLAGGPILGPLSCLTRSGKVIVETALADKSESPGSRPR